MLLTTEKSLCEICQKIVVSKDSGTPREHRARNPDGQFHLRHYKLDGDIIYQEKCCDFLLLNDSTKKAYFIELKGGNIDEAVPQLEAAAGRCGKELAGYTFYYRIVTSKVRTHNVAKNTFRKFQDKCGNRLAYKSSCLEETLS